MFEKIPPDVGMPARSGKKLFANMVNLSYSHSSVGISTAGRDLPCHIKKLVEKYFQNVYRPNSTREICHPHSISPNKPSAFC